MLWQNKGEEGGGLTPCKFLYPCQSLSLYLYLSLLGLFAQQSWELMAARDQSPPSHLASSMLELGGS